MVEGLVHLESYAKAAIKDLGGNEDNWLAIATQWMLEKGEEWWNDPQPGYNVGNVRNHLGEFESFATLNDGVWGYIHFLQNDIEMTTAKICTHYPSPTELQKILEKYIPLYSPHTVRLKVEKFYRTISIDKSDETC